MDPTLLIWSWLSVLNKKRYDALREKFGDLETALQHLDETLLKELGCKEETIFKTLNRLDDFDPDAYHHELTKRGLTLIFIEDDAYPVSLNSLPDAPVFLYYRGDINLLDQPCVALVGTRNMSSYGQRVAEHFVPALVQAGLVTVSGLATGVDTIVAKESLSSSGKTVAVLGHGLGMISPSANARLADEIVEAGGLILSEYPLDISPDKHTFPARNRIIAGLSLGTVVLEAPLSSGALITADLALDYGREVFAVPGQVFDENFQGCNDYISRGLAKSVTEPNQILQEIGIVSSASSSPRVLYEPQNEEESKIYQALTTMPQSVTEIVEKSALEASKINATLTMMEVQGAVKNTGGGLWVRN